jgi:acetylornithine deacetylase
MELDCVTAALYSRQQFQFESQFQLEAGRNPELIEEILNPHPVSPPCYVSGQAPPGRDKGGPTALKLKLKLLSSLRMDVFALTRQLVDIESVTGNEGAVGEFLYRLLRDLGYETRLDTVESNRFNVYAVPPNQARPAVFFSTHMDTVPPFFASREDGTRIYGRGACDAKGIIAAQIGAAEKLRHDGLAAGLLFVVGEERNSAGAKYANQHPAGGRFLIDGEPTDNRLAKATKGAVRVEFFAEGRMAHSAYPELGESAIEKLLDALERVRRIPLPRDEEFGPCTLNIGLIDGGRAPNVIPDYAHAELMYRTIGPSDELKRQIVAAAEPLARVEWGLELPFIRLRTLDGIPTMIAAFATDVPSLTNWGEALLLGPGSIHVAHTPDEHIEKKELLAAVDLYADVARRLMAKS